MSQAISTDRLRASDLTIQQTMDELGVSRDTICRLIRRGELSAYDISAVPGAKRRALRIRRSSIVDFKERRAVTSKLSLQSLLEDL